MDRDQAFREIIREMTHSGFNTNSIADALLHLDTHEPTPERVSLLSRGYGTDKTETLLSDWKEMEYGDN